MAENSESSYHTEALDAAGTITGAGYQTALSPAVSDAVQPESSVSAEPDSLEQPADLPGDPPAEILSGDPQSEILSGAPPSEVPTEPRVSARGSASGIPIGRIYPVTMPRMRAAPEPSQWQEEQEASPLPEPLPERPARSRRPAQPTETGAMLGPTRRASPRGGRVLLIAGAAGMIVAGVVIGGSMFSSSEPLPAPTPMAITSAASMAGWTSEEPTPSVTATPAAQVATPVPSRKTHLAKKAKGAKSAKKSKKAVAGKASRTSRHTG